MKQLVGILPAAGIGSRLRPFRYAKELMPVAFAPGPAPGSVQPVLAVEYSLRALQKAGVSRCLVVIADWKTEIIRYLRDGVDWRMSLAYLHRAAARGLADAIDAASPWIADAHVCLALPDTVFTPDTAIALVRDECLRRNADLCLGVFPTTTPQDLGPVRMAPDGGVVEVFDKPETSTILNTWGVAVWSPRFSRLLHDRVMTHVDVRDLVLGDVFNDAIAEGLSVCAVEFGDGTFVDVGSAAGMGALVLPEAPTNP